MYYAYNLLMSNGEIYSGFTSDLKRRMVEHDAGNNDTTKKYLPVVLVHYEAFLNKDDAKRREVYFKTSKGKTTLRLMLREYLKTRVGSSAGRAEDS